jgi:hypothetical protein
VPKYYEGGLKVLNDNRELFSTFVENKIHLDQATEVRLPMFESHVDGADVFSITNSLSRTKLPRRYL